MMHIEDAYLIVSVLIVAIERYCIEHDVPSFLSLQLDILVCLYPHALDRSVLVYVGSYNLTPRTYFALGLLALPIVSLMYYLYFQ